MKRRLSVENRMLIEQLLRLNYKLKDIAFYVDSTSSTVSREIKNRRITGKGDFKECDKTNRFPYVCNGCELKTRCRKKKYYYNYIKAQKNYNYLLEKPRIGIDMSIDEIDYWNDYFKDKIKNKNQPITHLFNNIKNEFPKSIQTFYNYVHKGYFSSINDEMLPRAYSYKPRKRTNEKPTIRFDNVIRTGRTLKEMEEYIEKHPEYGRIICRCETISEGEILDAIRRSPKPVSLDGIKRRCNAGMGRCQSGFCGPRVQEILANELGVSQLDIVLDKNGSYILCGRTKENGDE